MNDESNTQIRICELDDCDNIIDHNFNSNKRFCCDSHASLYRVRKKRLKEKQNRKQPYLITGLKCPVDGKVFPVQMFKKRGRPKKYDCNGCREIARQLRMLELEMKLNINKP